MFPAGPSIDMKGSDTVVNVNGVLGGKPGYLSYMITSFIFSGPSIFFSYMTERFLVWLFILLSLMRCHIISFILLVCLAHFATWQTPRTV